MSVLGLHTQREIDPLVGYAKKRERMEGKQLPRGHRVEAFGQTAVLFPELALVGLLARADDEHDQGMVAHVHEACSSLMADESFLELSEAVRRALHGRAGWTLDDVVLGMVEHAEDALLHWHRRLWSVEEELSEMGIVIDAQLGQVISVDADDFHIQLVDGGRRKRAPRNSTPVALATGSWVACDDVSLGARSGHLLLSCVAPDIAPTMARLDEIRLEGLWEQMLPDAGQVSRNSYRPPVGEERDGMVATIDDEFAIVVDPLLYAGASTMRSQLQVDGR